MIRLVVTLVFLPLLISVPSHPTVGSLTHASGPVAVTLPGDVDLSGGVSTSDIIQMVNYLFRGGSLTAPACVANVNADSTISLGDVICLVNYIFRQGPQLQDGCPGDLADFWPLTLGNYWIYTCDSQHPFCSGDPIFRWDVTDRGGDTAVVFETCIQWGCADTFHLRLQGPSVELGQPNGEWALYYRFVDSAYWVHADPFICDDSVWYRATLETEPIVTPAGTFFGCLRIEPLQKRCADAGTVREWWAPGLGMVRWQTDNIAGYVDYVLTEYRAD